MTGVVAERAAGGYVRVNASRGVTLCCGGYLGNPAEMMAALQPKVGDVTVHNWTWPGTNGDGIKAGLWAGAAMDPMHSVNS